MKIKTTMIFYLMLIRMADRQAGIRKKEGEKKKQRNVGRDEEKNDHITLLVRLQDGAIAIENIMGVPQKVKYRTPCDAAVLLLGIYPKELKAGF